MVSVMKADEVWGVRAVRSATEDGGGSMGLPFVRRLGLDQSVTFTKVEAGLVELEWFAAEHLESLDGIVQGGVLDVIADFSQGHAFSTTLEAPQGFSTTDFATRFLRPVRTKQVMTVTSRVVSRSRSGGLVETEFHDETGTLTTRVTGGWRLSARAFQVEGNERAA